MILGRPYVLGPGLDWRQPWSWPRRFQHGVRTLAVLLGMGLVIPMVWRTGQAWCEAREVHTQVIAQVRATEALQVETAALQRTRDASSVHWGQASALLTTEASPGLQWMQQTTALPQHPPSLTALQLQQVPVHLQMRGAWLAWEQWLKRWPQVAPGAALESLVLEVDHPHGIRADMTILATQEAVPVHAAARPLTSLASRLGGPFDVAHWTEEQLRHAQQHASYRERVVPELRREREPLEFFAREHLHYVGQISKGNEVQALVRVDEVEANSSHAGSPATFAPIHRVHVGSHLGQHFGRVSAIQANALWIKELVVNSGGEWVPRDIPLALQMQVP